MPNSTPSATDSANAPRVIVTEGQISIWMSSRPASLVASVPKAMPMMPPMPQSMAASMRNWVTMLLRSAPIARRMPISLVRSVTVTSMMFMMPMPPTSRLIAAMPPSTTLIMVACSL